MKLALCVIFSLCCFVALAFGVWLVTPPLRGPPGKQEEDVISALKSIASCSDAMKILPSPQSTQQWIYPQGNDNSTKVEVLCDFTVDGGGWTVIQKRSSGPREEFNRTWSEYVTGFGSLDRNFWLGLENIRALSKNGDQELRIELEDFQGNKKVAKYSSFSISAASDFYRLSIGGFDGNSTASDSAYFGSRYIDNGMRFSTKDKDNDLFRRLNCVEHFGGGGWWINWCSKISNLNGAYQEKGEDSTDLEGILGYPWENEYGEYVSVAKSEMKVRKRKPESE